MRHLASSLRFRLVAAMILVFVAALAGSSALDVFGSALLGDREPYQDGLILLLFGTFALVLIWLVSFWSLRPLARAAREARRAGPRDPQARISRIGMPAEIADLVDAVNGALDRLAAAYEAERRFTADAAHELRTPLAVLSLRLQRARGAATPDWRAIDGDLGQMTRLVTQLLDLARKEQAGRVPGIAGDSLVNISRIGREAAAMILPLAEAAGRALEIDLPEALMLRGRPDDVRDMLANLLDNALTHGAGRVRLSGRLAQGTIILDVEDGGPGVNDSLRSAVFDRFRKGDAAAPGTGLGLAIVREVAASHGGEVGFVPGEACLIRVSLPASPA